MDNLCDKSTICFSLPRAKAEPVAFYFCVMCQHFIVASYLPLFFKKHLLCCINLSQLPYPQNCILRDEDKALN